MKTTIEIPNSLLEEARKLASQEGTTVRALVETGLRRVLAERKKKGTILQGQWTPARRCRCFLGAN